MIKESYIAHCKLYGGNGEELADGNSILNDVEFESAAEFYNTVKSKLLKDAPNAKNIIIVGVFKL